MMAVDKAGGAFPPHLAFGHLPHRRRIALLAFTQRQIHVSRAHIPLNRHRRKQIPTVIKNLDDYIQTKRYEKGLHLYQIAGKMGIETALILSWENGTRTPDEKQWQMLSDLLWFDLGVDFPKPHRGHLLGLHNQQKLHLINIPTYHCCEARC